jgi:hypothetical protein
MWWMNLASTRTRRDERGATAIIVAIVMTALMSVAALAVDVAAMHQERRELQSGADAAALALAQDCARSSCGTTLAMTTTAKTFANANAHDALARIMQITPAANQITVKVGTEQPTGGADKNTNTIDFTFARVFGVDGRDINASATARWSPVSAAETVPLTFSRCEWERETSNGTQFHHLNANGQLDPVPTDPPSVILFHDSGNANGNGNGKGNGNGNGSNECAAQAGQDVNHDGRLPGGFGWLQSIDCQATIVAPGWVAAKPGNGVPNDCEPSMLLNRPLLIAVFADEGSQVNQTYGTCTIGPGGKCYFIVGFAQMYVTGFRFPGGQQWTQNAPCNAPDTCIGGYFIDGLVSVADVLGGGSQDFGPTVIELVK